MTFYCNEDNTSSILDYFQAVNSKGATFGKMSPILLGSWKLETNNCMFKNWRSAKREGVILVSTNSFYSDRNSKFYFNGAFEGGAIFFRKIYHRLIKY